MQQQPSTQPVSGHLAATVGGLLVALPAGIAGGALGVIPADMLFQPEAGMANLVLLIFPLAAGTVATMCGMYVGVRAALNRYGHAAAHQTARVAALLVLAAAAATLVTSGLSLLAIPAVPVLARRMTTRPAPPPPPPPPGTRPDGHRAP